MLTVNSVKRLHYISLHTLINFTDPTHIPIRLKMKQVTNIHKTPH